MSWKLTGNPKTQVVTRALAEKFAKMDPAPNDRPLSENRMRVYEKIWRDGGMRPVQWAIGYCKETGGEYRVNGKHTSTLAAGLVGAAGIPDLYATVEIFECDTLADVSRLYATYDSKTQSRTVADINRSFAATVPALAEVDGGTINLCASAFWYSSLQEKYSTLQPAERAEALLEHPDFVVWTASLVGRSSNRGRATSISGARTHLKRMAVVAAMYSTYQKAPRIATEFWTAVRDETGTTPGEPTRKLARFLTLAMAKVEGKRHRIPDREFFVKCLRAWNAFRSGEPTNLQYSPAQDIPAVK